MPPALVDSAQGLALPPRSATLAVVTAAPPPVSIAISTSVGAWQK
jgi:hypothetical protein